MKTGTDCQFFGNYLYAARGQQFFDCKSPELAQKLGISVITSLNACQGCSYFKSDRLPSWEWAVGVTAKRPHRPYLQKTLLDLQANGFKNWEVFEDDHRGPFGNFYRACTELYLAHPFATVYMICQDDIEISPYARREVEKFDLDDKEVHCLPAIITLYSDPIDEKAVREYPLVKWGDWVRRDNGHESPGACCYVFSDHGLRDFLTDPVVLWHKRMGPTQGFRDIDGCVGIWAAKHGGIWHHVPPLVKHIGEVSSIDRG